MRVGDVVIDTNFGRMLGLVVKIAGHGAHILVQYSHGPLLWEHVSIKSWGWVRKLTDDERAIVNAAIAAEALRRIG